MDFLLNGKDWKKNLLDEAAEILSTDEVVEKKQKKVAKVAKWTVAKLDKKLNELKNDEFLIIDDLDIEIYHAAIGISKSTLDLLNKSPQLVKWSRNCPQVIDQNNLVFGQAFHTFILENNKFSKSFAIEPTNVNALGEKISRNSKAWREIIEGFEQENANKKILSFDEFEQIKAMKVSFDAHPIAENMLKNKISCEKSFFYKDENGIILKIRPDLISSINGRDFIIDLKTTADINKFAYAVGDYSYYLQDAFYSYVYSKIMKKNAFFGFIAVSKKLDCGRYPTRAFMLTEDEKNAGLAKVLDLIELAARCAKENKFGGFESIERPDFMKKADF